MVIRFLCPIGIRKATVSVMGPVFLPAPGFRGPDFGIPLGIRRLVEYLDTICLQNLRYT
jgi:hypothetical protein